MSYKSYGGDRYGSGDRYGGDSRRSSSRRGDSPPRSHRSRRSPSPGPSRRSPPKPRDSDALPEAFGRPEETKPDNALSVIQLMRSSYENSPLHRLYKYLEGKNKVKIWTRNYKEVRGVMTGYIVAFDKHWNIILSDVDEVYLKFKKNKSPFLRDVAPNENLPDIPAKTPKKKSADKSKAEQPKPEPKKQEGGEKKRKKGKKPKATSEKRQANMLFIRGDNIVIISPAMDDDDDEEEEEEEEIEIKTEPED